MISLAEINNFARTFKVPAETIEKDYVISWILLCLSKSTFKENFNFYGGTAIKRMYFEDHRYSEDIDLLSSNKYKLDHILQILSCLKYAKDKANLLLEINPDDIIKTNNRAQLYVNYLGYDEIIGAPKQIRLDFAMDMPLYGKVIEQKMIETYSDLANTNVKFSVMSLNTILANKLGLLMDLTRNEPRDIYDIWFLLQRTDKFDYNFNEVSKAFNEKYSFKPTLQILTSCLKNPSFKKNWASRLSKQISSLPDIDQVIADIVLTLKILFSA